PHLPGFVERVAAAASAPVAAALHDFQPTPEWIRAAWSGDPPEPRVLALAFVQPLAERFAETAAREDRGALCPVCARRPVAAVLREQDLGARRSLVCGFCATEWRFDRLGCLACPAERDVSVYTTPEIATVRVDACDACHIYWKTVDLTKNALAVPVVDELGSIPLDLWAQDQGYRKLQVNLFGW
ncbi:MAG: formate dehydrogenase accessory protein FdhE, partial [Bryobacteraceae bacterium]